MSWRASASRPAPPVTSTSADSLFGSSTPNHRPSSRIVSGSSASSLLARHMADMDDGASIRSGRSGRSGMTVSGRLWEGSGRAREDSSASSIATTRERRSTLGSRTSSGDGTGNEDGMEMELEDNPSTARPELAPSRSDSGDAVPRVVKRQRTSGNQHPPSRTSWLVSPAKKSGPAAPTVQVDTSHRLTASPSPSVSSPPNHLDPPPLSLADDVVDPSSTVRKAKSLLKFDPAAPSPESAPVISATYGSTALEPPTSRSSAPISNQKKSWFGRGPPPDQDASPARVEPANEPPVDADGDSSMTSSDRPAGSSTSDTPTSASSSLALDPTSSQPQDRARQLALQKASASIVSQSASRGWFSMLSRATPAPASQQDGPSSDGTSASAESSAFATATEGSSDGGSKVSTTADQNDTIKPFSAPSITPTDYDGDTVTPRPSRAPVSSVARSSWWGWGAAAEAEAGPSTNAATEDSLSTSQTEAGSADVSAETEMTVEEDRSVTPTPAPVAKSWLATLWGEFPDEAEARRKVVEAASIVAKKTNLLSDTAALAIEHPSTLPKDSVDAASAASSLSVDMPSVPPPAVTALKNQASWSIFPSRRAATSASTLLPNGTPPAISGKLGVPSSAASTRSRTSTNTDGGSAPSSPRLGPQGDAPLKPLTGSIRNSPRPAPYEPDPPIENLVLPTFTDTFLRPPRSFPPEKSKLTKAVSVVSSYLFSQPPSPTPPALTEKRQMIGADPGAKLPKSLEVMEEPQRLSKIKRVVTIGVHGWFPTQKLKVVFGEPTGTSVKFATEMHDSVHRYLESKDISSFNIQAIALEGHGKVEERVNKLYDQLVGREEWLEALEKADIVFLATHSQGSVVSTQLLARMLDQGLIVGANTHLLAMCAIAQGPFVYLNQSYALSPYFSLVESEAARELFEFQDPESVPSLKFSESLRIILSAGVKVTVVGSINDQVVPLYSALLSGVSHPGIIRAVYIDSQAFRTSDFLANLVIFAARLRNANLGDHDLVYHLSEALAGALTGVGHSKIYEEEDVYNLAVRYAFETTTLAEGPTFLDSKASAPALAISFNPRDRRNPYLLTWALRGIIEDPQIRELFGKELSALREAFDTWKPQTKTLKEVKLKLEGIRMLKRAPGGKL